MMMQASALGYERKVMGALPTEYPEIQNRIQENNKNWMGDVVMMDDV